MRSTRNSQIGEFYVLQPPQVPPEKGKEKFTCDILIYDEESDRHVRVTWGQALKACCIDSNDDGTAGSGGTNLIDGTKNMSHPTTNMGGTTLRKWYAKAKAIEKFNEQATQVDYSTVDPDIRIVVARPFIEHLMHSVVMAVSGRDTGATLFGPADMQLSAKCASELQPLLPSPWLDPIMCSNAHARSCLTAQHPSEDHRGCVPRSHARAHALRLAPPAERIDCGAQDTTRVTSRPSSRATLCDLNHTLGRPRAPLAHSALLCPHRKPQNVLVMRDVACAGYVAGCNTLFFAQNSNGSNDYNTAHATTNMMERLSFSNDVGAKYASMLAFPCTAQQFSSGHLDTVMSVTTRLLPWEVTTATGGDHRSFPGGQEVFKEYQAKLNLRSVHFGEDMKAAENQVRLPQTQTFPFPSAQLLAY